MLYQHFQPFFIIIFVSFISNDRIKIQTYQRYWRACLQGAEAYHPTERQRAPTLAKIAFCILVKVVEQRVDTIPLFSNIISCKK